ncbi:putative leucine-rich repeat-containing protein DDB_G0290503 isoform X2 [Euwallacea fornicatus]
MKSNSSDFEKTEAELNLASKTEDINSGCARAGPSSSEALEAKLTANRLFPKSQIDGKGVTGPPMPASSKIPLPLKNSGSTNIPPLLKNARSVVSRKGNQANKHTLEIQFINKNKRYLQMKKELMEKQKSVLDLYQNLVQIKKNLDELGRNVQLDEVKLVSSIAPKAPSPHSVMGVGEQISMEVVNKMKSSIEEIPQTLMNTCKNLLSRRALIVELLESVTKSDINVNQVSDKIKFLKCEGEQLQQSFEVVIQQHESKISELLVNWQKLLAEKRYEGNDSQIEEMRNQIKEEERLREESNTIIQDLQRKAENQKLSHDKTIAELNGVLQALKEQVTKLEQELENERKINGDIKSNNISNIQNLRLMTTKINDLENDKKEMQSSNAELHRTIRLMQDQMKQKEKKWQIEKEEMKINLKHQKNSLQKLTADKNHFETRMETAENAFRDTNGNLGFLSIERAAEDCGKRE